ncbi:MAG: ABC transporter ATP-binding protein [Solirubrobacterales bacterium]
MSALLDVRDLKVSFDTPDGVVRAVQGISYSVEPGRSLGIVGESGSGKTVGTLTIMGLTRAPNTEIEGEAMFEGENLLALDEERMREIRGNEIAMIFQDPLSSLHPFFTIGDQMVEAIRVHRKVSKGAAEDRAAELLGMVGIPDARQRLSGHPYELSGGMRQRVMIAMALANDPRLLIADEPTTALDVTVPAQILELIANLQRETGTALVIITHDLGVVAEVADEVAVMYAGRIVEQAPVDELFARPEHPYTWGLLDSIPRLDRPVSEGLTPIPGRPPSLIAPPSGCAFHPRCAFAMDECRSLRPPLEPSPAGPEHLVACHLDPKKRRERGR